MVIRRNAAEFLAQLLRSMRLTLDRDTKKANSYQFTSGVMVCAKSDTAHWRIARQFELRQTQKRYLCLVEGEVEPFADVIDLPLGKWVCCF